MEPFLHMRHQRTDCALMCSGANGKDFMETFIERYKTEFATSTARGDLKIVIGSGDTKQVGLELDSIQLSIFSHRFMSVAKDGVEIEIFQIMKKQLLVMVAQLTKRCIILFVKNEKDPQLSQMHQMGEEIQYDEAERRGIVTHAESVVDEWSNKDVREKARAFSRC